MSANLKHTLLGILPTPLRDAVQRHRLGRLSYSQEGEDLVLARLFEQIPQGIYVDVGAHHPVRFSNTYLFYRRGWRGVNIDALPGSMAPFRRMRPRDVNLELGVSGSPATLTFFAFEEPALNTFDPLLAQQRMAKGWPMREKIQVRCEPLASILSRHLHKLGSTDIQFMSVDVEGLDLAVLQSNDWERFRPRAVVAEILDHDLGTAAQSDIAQYLDGVGYRPFSKLHQSTIFLRRD